MKYLLWFKDRILLLLGVTIGILWLYIKELKSSRLERELARKKAHINAKSKSTKAMMEGINEEGKSISRGYFDGK